jgi:hypothetical protein
MGAETGKGRAARPMGEEKKVKREKTKEERKKEGETREVKKATRGEKAKGGCLPAPEDCGSGRSSRHSVCEIHRRSTG